MTSANLSKTIVSVSKEIIWEISNCSTLFFTEYKNAKFFPSQPFCVYKDNLYTYWTLELYPNGDCEKNKSNIGLFLDFDAKGSTEHADFDVKYTMTAVNNEKEKSLTWEEYQQSREDLESSGYGCVDFLPHRQLDNGFINDGKMKIHVKICVEFKIENNKPEPSTMKMDPKIKPKILKDFGMMFDNDALTDFKINTSDGKVFKVHKCILAARSPIFHAMLTTEMRESESGSSNIPDFNSKIMKEVLRFIYCDEVENLNELAPELIFAAEKYQLKELKDACLQMLSSLLHANFEVAVKFLKIAHLVPEADELFEKCFDLIISDFPDVANSLEWKKLPQSLVSKIVGKMIKRCNAINISTIAK